MPSPPGESRAGGIHPGPVLWNLVNRILAPTFLLELGEWVQVAAEALLWGSQPRSGGRVTAPLWGSQPRGPPACDGRTC